MFLLCNTVWSILALAFISITPRIISYAFHNVVALVVLATTTVLWLGGSIAIAFILGDAAESWKAIYSMTQPIIAFGFCIWATFAALMSMEVVGLLKSAYRNDGQGVLRDTDQYSLDSVANE